jgi:hypothetical protein
MRKASHDNTKARTGSKNRKAKQTSRTSAEAKGGSHHTSALSVAKDQMRGTRRYMVDQFGDFRNAQVPATLRDLAEKNVSQTRALYERSKDAVQSVLVSWNKSFSAVNQGAVALNLKLIGMTERNISTGFDLAMNLAGAKNVAEAVEMQSAYWRKQLSELRAQAEEVETLLSRLNSNVTDPMEAQWKSGGTSSRTRRSRKKRGI